MAPSALIISSLCWAFNYLLTVVFFRSFIIVNQDNLVTIFLTVSIQYLIASDMNIEVEIKFSYNVI